MKVLFLNTPLLFSCVPRIYPNGSDTLSLSLRNELTDVLLNIPITFTVDRLLNITIASQPLDFKAQNKYEVIIYNEISIIYLGKLIVLKEGTSIQDYQYLTQDDNGFKYKE